MTTWSMEKLLALVPFAQRKSFDLDIQRCKAMLDTNEPVSIIDFQSVRYDGSRQFVVLDHRGQVSWVVDEQRLTPILDFEHAREQADAWRAHQEKKALDTSIAPAPGPGSVRRM